ncbi:SWIM zinc finger family protein [Chroococcidiopsis sp. FACHB-1243]|nr:SWIM zinc finger family protein [Chroococcidiopsis sp. [FACHB-1243]]
MGKQGIVSADCTCPYDWGGLCKHQIAVLLAYDLYSLLQHLCC